MTRDDRHSLAPVRPARREELSHAAEDARSPAAPQQENRRLRCVIGRRGEKRAVVEVAARAHRPKKRGGERVPRRAKSARPQSASGLDGGVRAFQIARDLLARAARECIVVSERMRADLVPCGRGRAQHPRCDLRLAPDDEQGRLHLFERLEQSLQRHLRHCPPRAIVERERQPVDGRVAVKPVEVDRDREDHGERRDSSCR